ncbi:hypothetical protein DMENIID0001_056690 [Sergentomyia squamirostris]
MKKILLFISVVLVLLCGETCARWYALRTGRRDPGEVLLGFSRGASNFTTTPQEHDVRLEFDGTPGNNITFVHVNIFPGFSYAVYSTIGYYDYFWIQIYTPPTTTYLTAEIYVYGFPATPGAQAKPEIPEHEAKISTFYNDEN